MGLTTTSAVVIGKTPLNQTKPIASNLNSSSQSSLALGS